MKVLTIKDTEEVINVEVIKDEEGYTIKFINLSYEPDTDDVESALFHFDAKKVERLLDLLRQKIPTFYWYEEMKGHGMRGALTIGGHDESLTFVGYTSKTEGEGGKLCAHDMNDPIYEWEDGNEEKSKNI